MSKNDVIKSSTNILYLRDKRFVMNLLMVDTMIVGIKDIAKIVANIVAESVWSRIYNEIEKRSMELPNSDIICPIIISVKLWFLRMFINCSPL